MRLLKPNPGECVDRQTILELKIKYGSQGADENMTMESRDEGDKGLTRVKMDAPSKVNIEPFLAENEQIQKYLEKEFLYTIPAHKGSDYDKYLDDLAKVNEQLWKLEDQARILRDAPDRAQEAANIRAAEVLYTITELNDKRAMLVQRINGLFNINVQEKIHA
jgi:hypothetical protein